MVAGAYEPVSFHCKVISMGIELVSFAGRGKVERLY
jgi:hypothetical protein